MQPVSFNNPLVKRARQEAVFLASAAIDRCLTAAVDALDAAARASRSVAQRLQLADAGDALTKHRAALRNTFPGRLDEAMGQALAAAREASDGPGRATFDEDALALVEDAEVSRFVEASRLQQTAMPVVEQSLARLDSLMSSALGLAVVRADLNPLRPDVACSALLSLLDELPEPADQRAQWVRHIAKPFARELDGLYQSVTRLLEDEGVEEARYRLKLTEGGLPPLRGGGDGAGGGGGGGGGGGSGDGYGGGYGGDGAGGSAGVAGGGGGALGDDAELLRQRRALFPHMEELAAAQPRVPQALMRDFLYRAQWVAEQDEPLPAGYYAAVQEQAAALAQAPEPLYDDAAAERTRERARAQSVVDRPARTVAAEMPLAPAEWGEAASPAVRTRTLMELKARASKVSEVLGLDAVRTLVGQVAGDERVLAPVREAFVALEPALLRMATAEPRFFGDDHHPARRLIEGIAQRSFKYNDEYSDEFAEFMAPVRQAVRALNDEPEVASEQFAARLQQLEGDWRAQDEAEQHARERGLRSMHFAQERQQLADKIAWEFSLRSDLDGVPAAVADFLFQDWSLVIAHAQLTDKRGQLDPGGYLAVVSDLLWSVKREAALRQPARLFEILPGLVQTLRRGLDMLGKEPEETESFFDTLMRLHDPVLRLRRVRSAQDAEASGFSRLPSGYGALELPSEPLPTERPKPRAAEQPWLGREELAVAGFEEAPETAQTPLEPAADTAFAHAEAGGADVDADGFANTQPLAGQAADSHSGRDEGAVAAARSGAAVAGAAGAAPPHAASVASRAGASGLVPLDVAPAGAPEAVQSVSAPAAGARSGVAMPASARENAEQAEARTRSQLARLRMGDWVDLNVRGQWRRARLHWSSDNGALFMFISRGGTPHSMTRRTCEKLIRARQLRPVAVGAVVDKALRRLGEAETEARAAATAR